MNTLIKVIITLVTVSFTVLYASDVDTHAGHNHATHEHDHQTGIKSKSIQKIAQSEVQRLVLEKKIAPSWKSIPVAKIGNTQNSYIDDWIVVFENPQIKKKSRRSLYIFVSKMGNVTGANYTGK